jgi:hypoxanthine phosphoribosyltransferase
MTQATIDLQTVQTALTEATCLATPLDVEAALDKMAAAITQRLQNTNPLVYVVMNGGLVLAGRLLPRLFFPLEVAYLHASRYGHALRGQELHWKVRPEQNLHGRTVLVLDDILDEGHTLLAILDYLRAQGADDVVSAVLVSKDHNRKALPEMRADVTGMVLPDRFLFGCGMDYHGYWRNAPGIYALNQ